MMISVNETEQGYFCYKYAGGSKVPGTEKTFSSKEKLTAFLGSLPGANPEYIAVQLEVL